MYSHIEQSHVVSIVEQSHVVSEVEQSHVVFDIEYPYVFSVEVHSNELSNVEQPMFSGM